MVHGWLSSMAIVVDGTNQPVPSQLVVAGTVILLFWVHRQIKIKKFMDIIHGHRGRWHQPTRSKPTRHRGNGNTFVLATDGLKF
jgi:hypothetical protein